MRPETKSWLQTFLAGFLATVLGIALTFGIESRMNTRKKLKTAHLLAENFRLRARVRGLEQENARLKGYGSSLLCEYRTFLSFIK